MSEPNTAANVEGDRVLAARARVPDYVVYREFVNETVVLNLRTGRYHGVNRTGARMLDVLQKSETVADAAEQLAGEYGRPVSEIESDLGAFCTALADRGLIELVDADG